MNSKTTRALIGYYGLLQSLHLLILIRAGILMLSGNTFPFPILPPPGGWHTQTMPFFFGLAGMDVIGIILGIAFAAAVVFKNSVKHILGLLSLTIFITGAIVFAVGTFPTGAWRAHAIAYWGMAALFSPVPVLFFKLLHTKPLNNENQL
jgi:hypothetical protein